MIGGLPENHFLLCLEDQIYQEKSLFSYTKKLQKEFPNKSIVSCVECEKLYENFRNELLKAGIPTFRSICKAADSIFGGSSKMSHSL
jgi:hypothetical protein